MTLSTEADPLGHLDRGVARNQSLIGALNPAQPVGVAQGNQRNGQDDAGGGTEGDRTSEASSHEWLLSRVCGYFSSGAIWRRGTIAR